LDKVEAIAQEVAEEVVKEISGVEPSTKPQVRFREFGDSAITFQVRMFLPQLKGRAGYKHEFIKRLHKRFNAEGIEIPFPIRNVYIRGDESK
ncbi:MAG: mechanosensitive ion channel, partial [Holophagales bacterium]|nr:mechanosensitive ion channel [Holophagales bacterium]